VKVVIKINQNNLLEAISSTPRSKQNLSSLETNVDGNKFVDLERIKCYMETIHWCFEAPIFCETKY
jgi:hypothetical protein